MYTSIVVPLDGTSFSRQALALAIALAVRTRAAVHLVHVQEPPMRGGGAPAADTMLDDELHHQERAELVRLAAQLRENTALVIDAATIDGAGATALGRYVDTHRCDLVVMMSHGRGGFARAWMGSFADELVRHTSVPLLLVHPGAEWPTDLDEPLFRKVLVPLDGSAFADDVLDHAVSLSSPGETTFTLVTVVVPPMSLAYPDLSSGTFGDTAYLDTERDVAEAHLDARAAELREIGARVKTLVLMHPRPGRAILDAADEQQADAIALSTHGRGAVERMGVGSVADELIRHAKVPVLVHRPTGGEESQSGDARAFFASTSGGAAPA